MTPDVHAKQVGRHQLAQRSNRMRECGTGCQAAGHLPCHAGRVATACQWTTIRVQLHDSENAIEPRFPIYNQTRIAMTLKRFEEKIRKVSEAPTGCQSLQREDERNSASETCGSRHGSTQKCHVRLQELHMAHILLNLEDQVRAVLHWSGYQRQQMRWYINTFPRPCASYCFSTGVQAYTCM